MQVHSKEIELAWAAGFYDGEGCCTIMDSNGRLRLHLSVSQVDKRPLERFVKALEIEETTKIILHKRKNSEPKWNDIHLWQTSKQSVVFEVMNKLWPYLSLPKKEQARNNLNLIKENQRPRKRYANGTTPHGTESKYTNGGCRCSLCKEAMRIANYNRYWARRYRERETNR